MIIYFLLIGAASLMMGVEFLADTQSKGIEKAILVEFQNYSDGKVNGDEIFKPIQRLRSKAILMIGVIMLVIVIVLTMFIKNITEPLQHMIETVREISAGDLSRTVRIHSNNELAMLGTVINEMSTNLQEILVLTGNMCDTGRQLFETTNDLIDTKKLPESDLIALKTAMDRHHSEVMMITDVLAYFNFYSVEKKDA